MNRAPAEPVKFNNVLMRTQKCATTCLLRTLAFYLLLERALFEFLGTLSFNPKMALTVYMFLLAIGSLLLKVVMFEYVMCCPIDLLSIRWQNPLNLTLFADEDMISLRGTI